MKQRSSLSLTIITTLAIWIIVGGILRTIFKSIEVIDDSFGSFLTNAISATITIIYLYSVKKNLNIFVPSLRPEIKRINPTLVVVGIVMVMAMNIALRPLINILPEIGMDFLEGYMRTGIWAMVSAIIVAPIFEEFVCRGVFQTNLENRFGPLMGILLSSLIFGVIHVIPQQAMGAFGAGLVLGSIYYLTRSLNTVIVLHALINGIAFLLMITLGDASELENMLEENATANIISYAASLIILILGGAYVINYARQRKVAK